MKEIIYNIDKLSDIDIDEVVIRTKALIINSKNEILLGYSDNTYQFIGGHLEDDETINECIKREVKEETGIDIDSNIDPFYKIVYYTKNYRDTDKNRKNIIYYYYIYTDKEYDMDNTNLDEHEILDHFVLKRISLDKVRGVLLGSVNDKRGNDVIVNEMITVIDEYYNIINYN